MAQRQPERSPATLLTLLGIYPISHCLMVCLDTKDVLRLCQTSWEVRKTIKTNEWDVNDKLTRFVHDPVRFRSYLGRFDALISGSFALQFFERVVWRDSDLDIMIRDGTGIQELVELLQEKEGYQVTSSKCFHDEDDLDIIEDGYRCSEFPDMKKVLTLHYRGGQGNFLTSKTAESKIQLIVTYGPPVQAILRGYYTSCIVNFISWNKAYSIFPRATFLSYETVPLKALDTYFGGLHSKYSGRGWRMRTEPVDSFQCDYRLDRSPEQCEPLGSLSVFDGNRRVGDRDSWIIRLDTTAMAQPSKPDFVLEYSCFSVIPSFVDYNIVESGTWDELEGTLHITIRAGLFKSCSLRYQYTYGYAKHLDYEKREAMGLTSYDWSLDPFWVVLGRKMCRNTLGQLFKFGRSKLDDLVGDRTSSQIIRPRHYEIDIEQPEGWDYYDDIIPRMYHQFMVKSHHLVSR